MDWEHNDSYRIKTLTDVTQQFLFLIFFLSMNCNIENILKPTTTCWARILSATSQNSNVTDIFLEFLAGWEMAGSKLEWSCIWKG